MFPDSPWRLSADSALNDAIFINASPEATMIALHNEPAGQSVSAEMGRTFKIQTGDQINVQLFDRTRHRVPVTFHRRANLVELLREE